MASKGRNTLLQYRNDIFYKIFLLIHSTTTTTTTLLHYSLIAHWPSLRVIQQERRLSYNWSHNTSSTIFPTSLLYISKTSFFFSTLIILCTYSNQNNFPIVLESCAAYCYYVHGYNRRYHHYYHRVLLQFCTILQCMPSYPSFTYRRNDYYHTQCMISKNCITTYPEF